MVLNKFSRNIPSSAPHGYLVHRTWLTMIQVSINIYFTYIHQLTFKRVGFIWFTFQCHVSTSHSLSAVYVCVPLLPFFTDRVTNPLHTFVLWVSAHVDIQVSSAFWNMIRDRVYSYLVNTIFPRRPLIGWQCSLHPTKSHVWKLSSPSSAVNMHEWIGSALFLDNGLAPIRNQAII